MADRYNPDVVILGLNPSFVARVMEHDTAPFSTRDAREPEPTALDRIKRLPIVLQTFLFQRTMTVPFLRGNLQRLCYSLGAMEERLDVRNGALVAYGFDVSAIDPTRLAEVVDAYTSLEQRLRQFQEFLQDQGVPMIVAIIPNRFTISHVPADNLQNVRMEKARIDPIGRFRDILERLAIPYADGPALLQREQERMAADEQEWNALYCINDFVHLMDRDDDGVVLRHLEALIPERVGRGSFPA